MRELQQLWEDIFMNFIFISPQFPTNYYHFCAELKNNGVNVLGIGDSAYDSLPYSLKNVLTEYYKVESMEHRMPDCAQIFISPVVFS